MLRSAFLLLASVAILVSVGSSSEKAPIEIASTKLAKISGGSTQYCVIVLSPDPAGENCYDCTPIAGGGGFEKCGSSDVDESWQYISGMDPASVITFSDVGCGGYRLTYALSGCLVDTTPYPPAECTRQVTQDGGASGAPGVSCP